MTLPKEWGEKYARRIEASADPQAEVQAVANAINGLVYTSDNSPISAADKKLIVDLIEDELKQGPREGLVWIQKEAENKRYLQLVQSLRLLVKG